MTVSTTLVKKHFKKSIITLVVAAFWLTVWYLLSRQVDQVLLLPSPATVLEAFCRLVQQPDFWKSIGGSLFRICFGFLLALLAGVFLAVITAQVSWIRALLSPLLHIIRAAPVASFIVLTLVWLQTDTVPTFISFLMVLPIVWVNTEQGIRQTDPQLLEMSTVYGFSFRKKLRHIYLPSVKPYLLSAAVNGLGFAWKSGVSAEVLSLPEFSIGRNLYYAKNYLETPDVFAWTGMVILLSLVLERILLTITKRSQRRKGGVLRDTV